MATDRSGQGDGCAGLSGGSGGRGWETTGKAEKREVQALSAAEGSPPSLAVALSRFRIGKCHGRCFAVANVR